MPTTHWEAWMIISCFIVLIAVSDFAHIKEAIRVLRPFYQGTKATIKEAIAEYFYPLKWVKIRIWNKGIKLAWYKLWIRKNEFHPSLDYDPKLMECLGDKEWEEYKKDVGKRRQIAHERGLKSSTQI